MSGSRCLRTRATFWAVASLALLSLAVTVGAHAAGSAGFEAAYRAFAQAAGGDDGSIDAAASAFASLHAASPTNPVVTAYAGASTTLRARQARAPFDKMARAEDGLALLDQALSMLTPAHDAPIEHGTPGWLEVRFVAANTFLAVPSFMNRGAKGRKLLDEVLASPLLDQSPLPFQGSVWMRAAELAAKERRADDARRWLERDRRAQRAAGRPRPRDAEGARVSAATAVAPDVRASRETAVASGGDAVVELVGVTKTYRLGQHVSRALQGVDLSVQRGELLALTGPRAAARAPCSTCAA